MPLRAGLPQAPLEALSRGLVALSRTVAPSVKLTPPLVDLATRMSMSPEGNDS